MSAIDYMVYGVMAGIMVVALIVPAFVGSDGWVAPIVVLPFVVAYGLYDRRMKRRASSGD